MSIVHIRDLFPAGLDLLQDQENFLNELSETELMAISGGEKYNIPQDSLLIQLDNSSHFAALSVYPPRIVCIPC